MVKVLVVDDSPFFRRAIARILEKDPQIKVIGFAKDGEEAVQKVLELSPDVVTLDVEMPRKNGIEALKEIMEKKPTPVIMISALTTEGAEATIKALELGAIDFIPKGVDKGLLEFYNIEKELIAKVKSAKGKIGRVQKVRRLVGEHRKPSLGASSGASSKPASSPASIGLRGGHYEILAIGSSTGGPPALQSIFSNLEPSFRLPVVVAQHMPPLFTKLLAERLDSLTHLSVKEAEDGETVEDGTVYVAPGGKQMVVVPKSGKKVIKVMDSPPSIIFKPSVDLLFKSVADSYGRPVIGVVLTGMGQDGCKGAKDIKRKGGIIIAQDEATCVVYGMPRCVVENKLADYVLPLTEIPVVINSMVKK